MVLIKIILFSCAKRPPNAIGRCWTVAWDSKSVLKVVVAEAAHEGGAGVGAAAIDGGQGHAVEGVGFNHGVEGHVVEDEFVAHGQRLVEGVVADDVAGQAGWPAEAIGVGAFAGFAGMFQRRAIGHFDDVGHVAGGGGVDDGDVHAVVDEVDDAGDKVAGVEDDGFSRFEVDVEVIVFAQSAQGLNEGVDVVVSTGDVVAATEIEPFHLLQEVAEIAFHNV